MHGASAQQTWVIEQSVTRTDSGYARPFRFHSDFNYQYAISTRLPPGATLAKHANAIAKSGAEQLAP